LKICLYEEAIGTYASVGIAASYFADNMKLSLKKLSISWREYSAELY